ncbi:hypothetical protein KP509_20G083600 [Ceratopteris richardii]|nr:hypothetical protein KP509_20G083600 [Ceratopteris richardii]
MRSPLMRLVRYRIKLLRYLETLVFLLLLGPLLPELAAPFYADWGMAEACLLGFLAGLITIFLNENKSLDMRTPWYPYLDFNSTFYGHMWDAVRVAGGSLLVPFEEELFYHSWMYRYFCSRLSGKEQHQSLLDVPFSECNWGALIATNGFMAIYNGKEWRSSGLSGLFSNWVIVRRGRFMDGVFAHAIRNITINIWVLVTDQRQFW